MKKKYFSIILKNNIKYYEKIFFSKYQALKFVKKNYMKYINSGVQYFLNVRKVKDSSFISIREII